MQKVHKWKMLNKVILAIIAFGVLHFQVLSAQEQPSVDAARQHPYMQRLLAVYEETEQLWTAYHLARTSVILNDGVEATHWLNVLAVNGWKLGVDPMDFTISKLPLKGIKLRDQLNSVVPQSEGQSAISATVQGRYLFPEGIAYDPKRSLMFLGGLRETKLAAYDVLRGETKLVKLPADFSGVFYGMKKRSNVDELWLLNNQSPIIKGSARLRIWSQSDDSWRTIKAGGGNGTEFNDLCLTDSHVYITDSNEHKIYRGALDESELTVFFQHETMRSPNGIACNQEKNVVYVAHASGVWRVQLSEDQDLPQFSPIQVPEGYSLGGIDGLYSVGEKLVGIQNIMGAPKVVVVNLRVGSSTTVTLEFFDVMHPLFHIPTTGFVSGRCLYYLANSSMDWQEGSGREPDAPNILSLPLNSGNTCSL